MRPPAERGRPAPGLAGRRHAPLALAALLAACQPLPHPFAADAPKPGSPILALPDNTSVAIAPIEGAPRVFAEKLAPALALALQKREVAASARTASLSSRELDGRIQQMPAIGGKAALVALWRLRDPAGHLIGEQALRIDGTPGEWKAAGPAAIARVAAATADRLTPLLQGVALKAPAPQPGLQAAATPASPAGPTPASAPASPARPAPAAAPAPATTAAAHRHITLRIAEVSGAPGDGGQSLPRLIAAVLRRDGLAVVTDPKAAADFVLAATVAVGKASAGKQHIKIVWHLRRPGGGEVGTVGQENDVPAGLLDGPWGDVAYAVAMAAQGGILQLVARATPPAAAAAPPLARTGTGGKS